MVLQQGWILILRKGLGHMNKIDEEFRNVKKLCLHTCFKEWTK